MKNIKVKIRYDCPACSGTGKIPCCGSDNPRTESLYDKSYCPVCRGDGFIEEWKLWSEITPSTK